MAGSATDTGSVLGRCLGESPPRGLVSAYLFGGHAAGRAHRESDVDVAVLLTWDVYPAVRARFDERLRVTALLLPPHNELNGSISSC
jgi:nucleotidyltransferase-like protein